MSTSFEDVRFVVQTNHHGTILLDREMSSDSSIVMIEDTLLNAVAKIVTLVQWRDADAIVQVFSTGSGLAMAGLLRAHGLNVVQTHVWEECFPTDQFSDA